MDLVLGSGKWLKFWKAAGRSLGVGLRACAPQVGRTGWLVGWLVGWQVGLIGWLAGWPVRRSVEVPAAEAVGQADLVDGEPGVALQVQQLSQVDLEPATLLRLST